MTEVEKNESEFVYEIIKEETDSNFSTIRKTNITAEFTMAEVYEHLGELERLKNEVQGQIDLEKAAMDNVERNHDDAVSLVRSLEPLKQHAIFLWLKSLANLGELEPKISKIDEVIKSYQEEISDIKNQTGWTAPSIEVANVTSKSKHEEPANEESGDSSEGESKPE